MEWMPVDQDFFRRPTLALARALIGMALVKETPEGRAAGWIVETEAYCGPDDRAAHSYGGRRTKRTEVMFGEPGHAYAHVMHTHCLLNIVSEQAGCPQGVLIRALEPCEGLELMARRRGLGLRPHELASGPGKLSRALGITMADYGHAMWVRPLFVAAGREPGEIVAGPRVGIGNSGEARDYPWRFREAGNRNVSRPR
ncbi:DNA-3-methyladenine glycosylase [Paenibacillus pasadenensis]|uniref:Putative 3-methyladenine DNA glycosylase n=1 Tax=Paenibacillus pasadenensis TaxID=217090 RepID=A0A2N5NCV0_9BACL|nr:DNA-3-methyladenine glycosylase [Paenibacillus pasadenensis]PLT48165.1 DNA-3-methyladenine glycosylase II [Paenibacillus pasadenensis]